MVSPLTGLQKTQLNAVVGQMIKNTRSKQKSIAKLAARLYNELGEDRFKTEIMKIVKRRCGYKNNVSARKIVSGIVGVSRRRNRILNEQDKLVATKVLPTIYRMAEANLTGKELLRVVCPNPDSPENSEESSSSSSEDDSSSSSLDEIEDDDEEDLLPSPPPAPRKKRFQIRFRENAPAKRILFDDDEDGDSEGLRRLRPTQRRKL